MRVRVSVWQVRGHRVWVSVWLVRGRSVQVSVWLVRGRIRSEGMCECLGGERVRVRIQVRVWEVRGYK